MRRRAAIQARHQVQSASHSLHLLLMQDVAGFERIAARLGADSGVNLPKTQKNITMVACRMASVLRRHRCRSYAEFERLLDAGDPQARRQFISTLTTHTTHFFREPQHFVFLEQLLGSLPEPAAERPLRIWCAAASTGQEPYTILMTVLQRFPGLVRPGRLRFLASDIDRDALLKGSAGRYAEKEVLSIPPVMRNSTFDRDQLFWRVKPRLRSLITFAPFNLSMEEYPFQHSFQYIFCRNVLIYFKRSDAAAIIDKLARVLAPGGYLFLGHAETGFVRPRELHSVAPAIYRKGIK